MNLTDQQASNILKVHDTLWDAASSGTRIHTLIYQGNEYTIQIPGHKGYASVLLPNSNGTMFLWITQNIHKSTYGSLAIQRNNELGNSHRITWVVDTNNGGFSYRSNITTTRDSAGNLIHGAIEIYDGLGKAIVWSNNKHIVTRKAEF